MPPEIDYDALLEPVHFSFALERREFVQLLGAGLVVSVIGTALAQRRGGAAARWRLSRWPTTRGFGANSYCRRRHDHRAVRQSGCRARCRTEIAMAAAEELGVPLEQMQVVLADTGLTPDDGMTAGSGTTPRTIPSIRQAAAAVRKLLVDQAAEKWGIPAEEVEVSDGRAMRRQ